MRAEIYTRPQDDHPYSMAAITEAVGLCRDFAFLSDVSEKKFTDLS